MSNDYDYDLYDSFNLLLQPSFCFTILIFDANDFVLYFVIEIIFQRIMDLFKQLYKKNLILLLSFEGANLVKYIGSTEQKMICWARMLCVVRQRHTC